MTQDPSPSRPATAANPVDADPRPSARARLAEARRDQMRRRLIEAAILVFAERGLSGVVIADVIAQAGVARGSFYNHFRSTEELLEAACLEITAEILDQVEPRAAAAPGPAEALHIGIVLVLRIAQSHPVLGRFMAVLSLQANTLIADLSTLLPEQIAAGIAAGEFAAENPIAMTDLTVGMIRQASLRLVHHPDAPPDPDAFLRAASRLILRGLGLSEARISEIVEKPLPEIALAEDSLLLRAQRLQDALPPDTFSPLREER